MQTTVTDISADVMQTTVTLEDLPADVMGRVLDLCGPAHQDVVRTFAALAQSSKALRGMLGTASRDVRELDLRETRVTDALLRDVATTFTGLTSLKLPGCSDITDAGLAHLAQLTGLTSLDLAWCEDITDAGLKHLAQLTGLTWLDLRGCERITDAGVAHLRDLLPWCKVWC